MRIKVLIAAAALAFSTLFAGEGEAASYPTFVTDIGNSTIEVTQGSGCKFFSCADLTGEFAAGAQGFSWTPGSATDSTFVTDFFKWTVSGFGLEVFDVVVTLAFSQPDPVSTTSTGNGFYLTLGGVISGGALIWDGIQSITFGDGSILNIDYEETAVLGFGNSTKTGATFSVDLSNQIAAVPLPPTVPLLAVGLLSLGLLRRRRQSTV